MCFLCVLKFADKVANSKNLLYKNSHLCYNKHINLIKMFLESERTRFCENKRGYEPKAVRLGNTN